MKQGSAEWTELRKSMIGASDAPIIMGVSPWTTPYQLWAEKKGLAPKRETTEYMQNGHDMEPIALGAYEKETGETMFPMVIYSEKYPFAMASLDGMNMEKTRFVEIKNPGKEDHDMALSGKVPEKYWVQMQWQLECTGLDSGDYFSYREYFENGNKVISTKLIKVARDQEYIDKMMEVGAKFYACMQNMEPPALSPRDVIERNDELWQLAASNYQKAAEALKLAEQEEARLRQSLICMAGGFNCVGSGIKLTRVMRKGNVDYKLIPELKGVDTEQYRKPPTESWRITLGE